MSDKDPDPEVSAAIQMFNTVRLEITAQNSGTGTRAGPEQGIQMIELLPQGFVLELPSKLCARGHNISLEIVAKQGGETKLKLDATAKIDGIAPTESGTDEAVLVLVQYEEKDWQALRDLYGLRQQEIERFLSSARGW